MKEGPQPFRLRRPNGKALGDEYAALTVTEDGMLVLKVEGASRISVYSRYRKNYLDWVEQTSGRAAREAAAARISAGDQLHHLIPDGLAQRHPLIREALERLEGYTIDRGTNMLENELRKAIESGNLPAKVLKELVEDGIPVGKKLAMLELGRPGGSFTA